MEKLLTSLLRVLPETAVGQSPHELLTDVVTIWQTQLQADVTIGYELVSETGGVPRSAFRHQGELLEPGQSQEALATVTSIGLVADLIRQWQPKYNLSVTEWVAKYAKMDIPQEFIRFLQVEQIQTFTFLPVSNLQTKLVAFLICHRTSLPEMSSAHQTLLMACCDLIGVRLAQLYQKEKPAQDRKAMAHTLYGNLAAVFKGQIDVIEAEIVKALGNEIPPNLMEQLEAAKATVFEGMRNLVIEASGDLLVDLRQMSLAKALNTTSAALRRAWPTRQTMMIDIHPVPRVIENQPLRLRQLIYTLVLEALGNAVKHGGPAPYINIDVNWGDNCIYIQVLDHGQGFDLQKQSFSEYGLGFWHDYINGHLGGAFHVSSHPGYGTVVNARIPVIPTRIGGGYG